MIILLQIVLATLLISLASFIGIFTLTLNKKILEKSVFFMVALSVGGLMGGAFMHLLPESIEKIGGELSLIFALSGFFLFLLIEKIISWRHCHEVDCEIHSFAYMNLIGDGVHNFIDGLIMAASFIVSPAMGITSTLAIFLHEVPQEIGDFGVLIYAGFKRKTALFLNFLTALTAMVGGIIGYYFISSVGSITGPLLAFAAGGFIYIAASDLIPEIRKEKSIIKSIINFIIILFGLGLMYSLTFIK